MSGFNTTFRDLLSARRLAASRTEVKGLASFLVILSAESLHSFDFESCLRAIIGLFEFVSSTGCPCALLWSECVQSKVAGRFGKLKGSGFKAGQFCMCSFLASQRTRLRFLCNCDEFMSCISTCQHIHLHPIEASTAAKQEDDFTALASWAVAATFEAAFARSQEPDRVLAL